MAKSLNQRHVLLSVVSDWKLICILCHYRYCVTNLSAVQKDILFRSIYNQNDGYGIVGLVPPQGYDWSGIRDSSEGAQAKMAETARALLKQWNISILRYTQED